MGMHIIVVLLAFAAYAVDAKGVINLGSQTWTVENGNRSISTTTTLPAYPLEIMRANGFIGDPLFRYGELTSRWVALDNWTFSLSFNGSTPEMQQLRSNKQVLLKLGGIDTFATVTFNSKEVLTANNFHRHWTVPVKDLLIDGENELAITIRPATNESLRLQAEHPYAIPVIHQMGAVGAYTFARKPASDLGWDWGPAFAASGIHGAVELLGFSNAVLDAAHMSQSKPGDIFEVTITSQLLVPPGGDSGELTVSIPALNKTAKKLVQLGSAPTASLVTTLLVNASEVDLWWPVGYGAPKLYDVHITFTPDSPACTTAQTSNGQDSGSAIHESAQQMNWEQTTIDGAFRIMNGLDLPGTEVIARKEVNTMDGFLECQRWCNITAGCNMFTFGVPPSGFCELKKLSEVSSAVFGVKVDNGKFDLTAGINLEGFDLEKPTLAPSTSACEARCNRNAKCKVFVVMEGNCKMKEPWPASINRIMGIKLARSPVASAKGKPKSAVVATSTVKDPVLPTTTPASAITHLQHKDVNDDDDVLVAAVPAVMPGGSREIHPRVTPGAYTLTDFDLAGYMLDADNTPGGYAMKDVGVAGYMLTDSGTPGANDTEDVPAADYALGSTTAPGAYGLTNVEAISNIQDSVHASDEVQSSTATVDAACVAPASSKLSYRIGFRTVELVRLPIHEAVKDLFPEGKQGWDTNSTFGVTKSHWDGSWAMSQDSKWQHYPKPGDQPEIEGESFYFKVNGVPIYMKGANLVPLHILPTNASKAMVHDLMKYALDSNMNMIRIWGGGMYPTDDLFKFTDEHGLLVWMETMFACAPYPRNPEFLDNVAAEVTQQVQRLSWHPSVGVWAGNNEIEGSLNWYSESRTNKQLFAADYTALFIDTIRAIIKQAQPSMAFVDSSPSNGAIVDDDKQYIKRWGEDWDPRYGDVHHYAYEADCEDYSTYPKAKFISEFGSQSYPTFPTYAEATIPTDWQVDNPMTGFRNRRFGNGLEVFEAQFKRHFRLPNSWSVPNNPEASYKLFRSFLYITHMQQARCYETAINYWRRLRSQPAGLTMGVLYWQLNDIAPFASWSAYDYGGRWKPLAYAVKRMYAPLQVQIVQDGRWTKVFVVNDHTQAVNTTITVNILSLADTTDTCDKLQPAAAQLTAEVAPGYADMVWTMPTAQVLASRPGCSATSCYFAVTATGLVESSSGQTHTETSEAQMFLVPLKDINLPDPKLQLVDFKEDTLPADNSTESQALSFTLKSARPAVLTQLNTQLKGRFNDDAFTAMHPCQPKQIVFYPHAHAGGIIPAQLQAELTVVSLFDHQFGRASGSK